MTTTRDTRKIFKALVINPLSIGQADFYDPGYLIIRNGNIEEVTRKDPRPRYSNNEFRDLSGFTILPGLVDIHVHLPQFAIMGIGSESLLSWLQDYTYPEEMRFSDPGYAQEISERFFDALIANGTTCACIYCSVHEKATDLAFETASRKGCRAFIGKTMMDCNSPATLQEDTESSINTSLSLFEKWDGAHGGRLRYVFTPRFAGSSSARLMRLTSQLARQRNAFIQSHLSENLDEVRWIRSLFPSQSSYTDVYQSGGVLSSRTIMGHCIHLSDEEISMLQATRTKIAFCPYSNRALRSGRMPFERIAQAGLTVGLGTDIAGGPSLSMLRQMGVALNSANVLKPCLSPAGALYMATLGGAAALGLQDTIGNFTPGKDADFIVLDHTLTDPLSGKGPYNSPEQILSRLCYKGDSHCVKQVYIRGVAKLSARAYNAT
jgi:guanine deaminase